MYFTKYIPVEDEVKEGDRVRFFTPFRRYIGLVKDGKIIVFDKKKSYEMSNVLYKKVKLFLCSNDIHVGDEIVPISNWKCPISFKPVKVYTHAPLRGSHIIFNNKLSKFYMKVIGEISTPDLKENLEIDEKDINFEFLADTLVITIEENG